VIIARPLSEMFQRDDRRQWPGHRSGLRSRRRGPFWLDAFVAASFCTAGVAVGLPAVFAAGLLRAAGADFLTVLT